MKSLLRKAIALAVIPFVLFVCQDLGMAQTPAIEKKQQNLKPFPKAESRRSLPPPVTGPRAAPPGPVHSVAEWEESEGVMSLWWNYDLIDKLQARTPVYIPVDSTAERDSWITYLTGNGVPMGNIDFLFITTDTIYTRDYGPWFVWDANNDLGIVNYTCGYGVDDDLFPQNFAGLYGINYYESGLSHVGGNWYPNAYGKAFSTTLVYTQNGDMPMDTTNAAMLDYYGIANYNTCVVAPWTIEHHDCWGKPSNPETMLICQYDESSAYYPYGEGMNAHYETLESPWGRPYKIIRMPMFKMGTGWFEFRPYLNALVSNQSVYVAICNHPDDAEALAKFQEAFPGYEIVGVNYMNTGFNDALHCRTRNFVKRDAIRIYPMPPGDTEDTGSGYTVTAEVIPPNGSALQAGYPLIHWTTTGGAPFAGLVMNPAGPTNTYTADLPAQLLDTTVSYYIEARDNSGHSALYPLVAPGGMLSFNVRADTQAPVLSRFQPARSATAGQWPPVIRVLCKDDRVNPEVRVEYAINGVPQADLPLVREPGVYWYSGTLGGSVASGDLVTYRVKATDNAATPNTAILPAAGEVICPVSGPGSVAIIDLSRRPYTGPYIAKTLGELGIPCSRYTAWPTDWSEHEIWFVCLGIFADNHILSPGEANDLLDAFRAGHKVYLESGDAWCYNPEKDTINPWFGVQEVDDGEDLDTQVNGETGTFAEGLSLVYAGTNAYMDEIAPLVPAQMLFRSAADSKGRVVFYDAGTYRACASGYALGGLIDGAWPNTRKEILLRILEFFGVDGITLQASGTPRLNKPVTLRITGTPGDIYLLLLSPAEGYLPTDYGVLRLDAANLSIPRVGVIPPEGVVEIPLRVPGNPLKVGKDFHFQALLGQDLQPGQAELSNREILTIIE